MALEEDEKYEYYQVEHGFEDDGENGDVMALEREVDVFAWKSVQRVVFTLTNPVDTHQITIVNITATLKNQEGSLVESLPPVRFGEIVLSAHKTHSLAYEFRVQGADLDEEARYTFEVTMGYL